MKIELLSQDKIRIFLTFDDLLERGIQKDDMWREIQIPRVSELFSEMMDQAYSELGFDASGPLAVEVYALPAQGMVIIVTKGRMNGSSEEHMDEEEDVYDLEVALEETDIVKYVFHDFEDVITVSHQLRSIGLTEGGKLYSYQGKYVMVIEPEQLDEAISGSVIALLAEYGEVASVTYAMIEEYGKVIMNEAAIRQVTEHFAL